MSSSQASGPLQPTQQQRKPVRGAETRLRLRTAPGLVGGGRPTGAPVQGPRGTGRGREPCHAGTRPFRCWATDGEKDPGLGACGRRPEDQGWLAEGPGCYPWGCPSWSKLCLQRPLSCLGLFLVWGPSAWAARPWRERPQKGGQCPRAEGSLPWGPGGSLPSALSGKEPVPGLTRRPWGGPCTSGLQTPARGAAGRGGKGGGGRVTLTRSRSPLGWAPKIPTPRISLLLQCPTPSPVVPRPWLRAPSGGQAGAPEAEPGGTGSLLGGTGHLDTPSPACTQQAALGPGSPPWLPRELPAQSFYLRPQVSAPDPPLPFRAWWEPPQPRTQSQWKS